SPATWSDDKYNLWTADLENVVAEDLREVWIDDSRFEGSARIDGRFYFKPLRAVNVGPAKITVARGAVLTGPKTLVDDLAGTTLVVALSTLDPRTAEGDDFLHH